jgi:hypothetical protein
MHNHLLDEGQIILIVRLTIGPPFPAHSLGPGPLDPARNHGLDDARARQHLYPARRPAQQPLCLRIRPRETVKIALADSADRRSTAYLRAARQRHRPSLRALRAAQRARRIAPAAR